MVYVGDRYIADVFFSYAHGGQTDLRDWSRRIPSKLQREINVSLRLKDAAKIFEDRDLDRAGKFPDELEGAARGSAILLVVMSDYYLESDWCAKERNWFVESVRAHGREDDLIFVAHAFPADPDRWPPARWPKELQDRLGHLLHDEQHAKADRLTVRPFGWTQTTEGALETAIVQLAGKIATRLKRIREDNEALRAALSNPGVTEEKGFVYLHARPKDAAAWTSTRELLRGRFSILPSSGPRSTADTAPAEREQNRRIHAEMCAECDALLLLRQSVGEWIDLELMRVGRRFRQEVHQARGTPIPCAVVDFTRSALPLAEDLRITRLEVTPSCVAEVVAAWLSKLRAAQPTLVPV